MALHKTTSMHMLTAALYLTAQPLSVLNAADASNYSQQVYALAKPTLSQGSSTQTPEYQSESSVRSNGELPYRPFLGNQYGITHITSYGRETLVFIVINKEAFRERECEEVFYDYDLDGIVDAVRFEGDVERCSQFYGSRSGPQIAHNVETIDGVLYAGTTTLRVATEMHELTAYGQACVQERYDRHAQRLIRFLN